jgi:hypothetical protein
MKLFCLEMKQFTPQVLDRLHYEWNVPEFRKLGDQVLTLAAMKRQDFVEERLRFMERS